ncbi:MAG: hypothetical protein ACK5KP_03495 [Paludibacteraceae bacterium]
MSQNNTNSPYTRFGYGEITESSATEIRSMGGAGIANRSKNTINVLNPASHSSVDSMTFMFDVAVGARLSRFSGQSDRKNTFNSNLEYLTIRFPFSDWMGFSAGILPYSFSGYNFYQNDTINVSRVPDEPERVVPFTRSFNGSGGFSQVYGGLSVELFKHVSLGVNAYYMFGNVSNNRTLVFGESTGISSSLYSNQINVSDTRLRYGMQLYNTFAEKHDVTLGLIYENKNKLNGTFVAQLDGDTIHHKDGFELPRVLGLGLNYTFNKKLTVGVDYTMQNWGDALFFNKTDSLVNHRKLSVGAEYIPDPNGREYRNRIRYRIGFNTGNPYYKISNNTQPNDFSVTVGVGLPTRTGRSLMNASIEYARIGSSMLLREDYLKLTFSTSINENWFFKPKL